MRSPPPIHWMIFIWFQSVQCTGSQSIVTWLNSVTPTDIETLLPHFSLPT